EDAVAIHQPVDPGNEYLVLLEYFVEALKPSVRQVSREASYPAVCVGDARPGQAREMLVDVIADHHQIEKCRHRPELHQRSRDTRQVIRDARILGEERAEVAAPRRD